MKKSLSSVLSIFLVFVFMFMAVGSNRAAGDKLNSDKLPFGLDDIFGKNKAELTESTKDIYGFSENYETYPVYTFEETTESTTVTTATTTKPTATATQPTTRPATTRPTTTRPTTTRKPVTTTRPTTTVPSVNASLDSSSIGSVVSFYNTAVRRTYSGGAPEVYQTMGLRGNITGSGGIAPYISELQEILETDTDAFSGYTYGIPGEDDIEVDSVTRATATSNGGRTKIYIVFKDFSVSMNDIENIDPSELPEEFDDIFDGFGSSVVSGKNSVKLVLTNSYIDCTVDEKTGKIIDGTWNYDVDFEFGNAEMDISGVTLSLVDFCIPMRLRVTL